MFASQTNTSKVMFLFKKDTLHITTITHCKSPLRKELPQFVDMLVIKINWKHKQPVVSISALLCLLANCGQNCTKGNTLLLISPTALNVKLEVEL